MGVPYPTSVKPKSVNRWWRKQVRLSKKVRYKALLDSVLGVPVTATLQDCKIFLRSAEKDAALDYNSGVWSIGLHLVLNDYLIVPKDQSTWSWFRWVKFWANDFVGSHRLIWMGFGCFFLSGAMTGIGLYKICTSLILQLR